MRAFWTPNIDTSVTHYKVSGDDFTHFSKVLRGKLGANVLLLNGNGLCGYGSVVSIEKKSLEVEIGRFEVKDQLVKTELILCVPKKDYLSDILKMATEVGVAKIHLIVSDNTPWKFNYSDRFEKIIKSALLQSNNPFIPEVKTYSSIKSFLEENTELKIQAFLTEEDSSSDSFSGLGVLIGPEGGFSESEIKTLKESNKVGIKKLPNPIMKSVTAAIFALGHIQRV